MKLKTLLLYIYELLPIKKNKMNRTGTIFFLFLFPFISCKTSRVIDRNMDNQFQKKIESIYSSNPESIGILVHIEYPQKSISWSGAVGFSDKDLKTNVNVNQPVLIASNTKTFVSATILRLVEEEKLNIYSSIDTYLSDKTKQLMMNAGYDLKEIKTSHLLSHSSGINDYVSSIEFENKLQTEPKYQWTRDEQIEIAILQMDKIGNPGYKYKYSDTNYLLLTEIIEEVTGIEFHTVIRQLLDFENNGINSTWFEGLEAAPTGILPISHQYIVEWGIDTYDIDKSFDLYGGGGLASTTTDLSLFVHKLFNREIFKDLETLNLLLTKIETESRSNDDYRFGIWKSTLNEKIVYGHGGFWGTMVYHIPELNATISIAILNKDKSYLRKEIAELMLKEIEK